MLTDVWNDFRWETVPSWEKKKKIIDLKPFYSNTSYSLEYEKTA